METIVLPHLETHPLLIGLYTNVANASHLRQQLLAGNTDFEYAFLDASLVLSRSHVLAACFRAINAMRDGKLASRNVHSEIVFDLSPNNNISDSFRRHGLQETTANLIAIKVLPQSHSQPSQQEKELFETTTHHLKTNVQGTLKPFTDEILADLGDSHRIRKIYKLDPVPVEEGVERWRRKGVSAVVGGVALKGS